MLSMSSFFFFNDTATTEIYTLSLHDALPISVRIDLENVDPVFRNRGHIFVKQLERADTHGDQRECLQQLERGDDPQPDRKSTRLNSSHSQISYAVFCLKKKKYITVATMRHAT